MVRAKVSDSDTGDMRNAEHEVSCARFHGYNSNLRSLRRTAYWSIGFYPCQPGETSSPEIKWLRLKYTL